MPGERFKVTTESFELRTPWQLRIRLRWWGVKGFFGLAWRCRRRNPIRWARDVRHFRATSRAYLRDLERAAFFGPECDE